MKKKYNRKDHIERVKAIFKELSRNYRELDKSGLFVSVDKIIRDTEDSKDCQLGYIVEFSVLTKKIYDYDKETILRYEPKHPTEIPRKDENSVGSEYEIKDTNLLLDKGISIENYRPFFVFLTIRITEQELNRFKALKNRWLKAEFHKKPRPGDYSANLIFSASPFKRYTKSIEILDDKGPFFLDGKDINTLTNDDYDVNKFDSCLASTNDVEIELNNAWSGEGYDYINIYNVGHGNADYIVCHDEKSILYDIGTPLHDSLNSFPKAAHAFYQLKPNLVIISHWDTDHYMGCVYASDDVFNVKWIAPSRFTDGSKKTISINLFRFVAFLKVIGKLMLIDSKKYAGTLVVSSGKNDNVIKLRMGSSKARKTSKISKKNREGLYIELGEECKKISVFAGDVPYNSMDSSIFSKQLTFLHVPHHCSEMDTTISLQNSMWGEEAIISTNCKGLLGNPDVNASHQQELSRKFNNIHYTSEQQGSLCSIQLHKGGKVIKQ